VGCSCSCDPSTLPYWSVIGVVLVRWTHVSPPTQPKAGGPALRGRTGMHRPDLGPRDRPGLARCVRLRGTAGRSRTVPTRAKAECLFADPQARQARRPGRAAPGYPQVFADGMLAN
jgi:hypothetical protein